MYIYIIIFILISIIIFILYYTLLKKNVELKVDAVPNIFFMSHDETSRYLEVDNDNYVRNLTPLDLYARKVKDHQEYIENIKSTAISFTEDEKQLLIKCAKNADAFFKTNSFNNLNYSNYLNGDDIANIKWIFAYTFKNDKKEYEEGLPHTRENVIFLSKYVLKYDEFNLTNTLIHEKIHIYQRFNKELFSSIISYMNYSILDIDKQPYKKYIRSNPDTDGKVYYDMNTQKEMICLYRSDKPNSINDIIMNNFALEHPYEKIAYDIADCYYKINIKYTDKYIQL